MDIVKAASGGTFQSLGLTFLARPQSPISHRRLRMSTPFHLPFRCGYPSVLLPSVTPSMSSPLSPRIGSMLGTSYPPPSFLPLLNPIGASDALFRTRIGLLEQRVVCKAKPKKILEDFEAVYEGNTPVSTRGNRTVIKIPETWMVAEKEEAKAILTLFLREQGLGLVLARRTARKSGRFVDHLLSKLHTTHPRRYLVGRELTTHEIREVLFPYLESFLEEHGGAVVDAVEQFPNLPDRKKTAALVATLPVAPSPKKKEEEAVAPPSERGFGDYSPQALYLREIGFDLNQIKEITEKFPSFAYYSLEGKLKPIVEFLLDLGMDQKDIPVILCKRPQLCGVSIKENLIPTMACLEGLGVDRTQWAKVIRRCPTLLTHSNQKLRTTVDYLFELGISAEDIGGILTRSPKIVSYSVANKLRPIGEYFGSLGIDVASLMCCYPQTFGSSLKGSLKPITKFFLDRGFTIDDIRTMVAKYKALYTLSLERNLMPKWEFFLEMGYPKSDLVTFPNFFGYKLELRIKPRYTRAKECGVQMVLNEMLSVSDKQFEEILEKRMRNVV